MALSRSPDLQVGFAIMPLVQLQTLARDLFCGHSILWSNIPGPVKPVFLCGKRVLEMRPAVATIQHQVRSLESYLEGRSPMFDISFFLFTYLSSLAVPFDSRISTFSLKSQSLVSLFHGLRMPLSSLFLSLFLSR